MRCELLLTNLNSNLTAVSEYGKKITNQKKKTYIVHSCISSFHWAQIICLLKKTINIFPKRIFDLLMSSILYLVIFEILSIHNVCTARVQIIAIGLACKGPLTKF